MRWSVAWHMIVCRKMQGGSPGSKHRLAIERSLSLHREVAARIEADPSLVNRALERVRGWMADGTVSPFYARAWIGILERPASEVATFLVEDSERAHDLRQVSPFAGVLEPRTRWKILKSVRKTRDS